MGIENLEALKMEKINKLYMPNSNISKEYSKRIPGSTINDYHRWLLTKLTKYLNKTSEELVIVDIGGGAGAPLKHFLRYLRKQGYRIASTYSFDIAYSNAYSEDGIYFYPADINKDKLPLKENSVDIVIATEIIEHLLIPENLLSEANRILKNDGLLLLSTPNLRWWVNILLLIAGYPALTLETGYYENYGQLLKYPPAGHIRGYTPKALRLMLERFGFNIEEIATIPHPNLKIRVIDKLLSIVGLGYWNVVIARKSG